MAVMPDVHLGIGKDATVGSVIPTKGAIVPLSARRSAARSAMPT
jgi:hypothetical protein